MFHSFNHLWGSTGFKLYTADIFYSACECASNTCGMISQGVVLHWFLRYLDSSLRAMWNLLLNVFCFTCSNVDVISHGCGIVVCSQPSKLGVFALCLAITGLSDNASSLFIYPASFLTPV